jgi:methylmalonyl-CoA mutase, N-terminal domain
MTNRKSWQAAFDASPVREGVDAITMSGIPLDPVYGPDDALFPGQYPYTRGVDASGP